MTFILTTQERSKLDPVLSDYRNGNLEKAARGVRKLTKKQLVSLLLSNHQCELGFAGDGPGQYEFEKFISCSLDNYY